MKKNIGKPLQRAQPQQKPIHNPRQPSKPSRQPSVPKNTKKQKQNLAKPTPTPIQPKVTSPPPSPQQILKKIEQINIQQLNFQQCWNILAQHVHQYMNFVAMFPKPIHDHGHALLADGRFIVAWIKIVGKSGCVNDNMLVKYVQEKFMGLISKNKELVINYLKGKEEQKKQQKTPAKPLLPKQSLKRSILKNSQKKVQFGKDQILYPTLDSYISANAPQNVSTPGQTQNLILTLQQQKNRIRTKHGYLLDYFQINEILLLEQVDVIGILTQLQPYAIVLVKMKSGQKGEKICIVVSKGEVLHEQFTDVFRQIQRSYENLVYLEIYGKNTAQIWVDSLPSQKGK